LVAGILPVFVMTRGVIHQCEPSSRHSHAGPLFFASDALYPVPIMPAWLKVLSLVNPLSYEVDALRGLLINWPSHVGLDFAVLIGAVLVDVTTASSLVGRLAR